MVAKKIESKRSAVHQQAAQGHVAVEDRQRAVGCQRGSDVRVVKQELRAEQVDGASAAGDERTRDRAAGKVQRAVTVDCEATTEGPAGYIDRAAVEGVEGVADRTGGNVDLGAYGLEIAAHSAACEDDRAVRPRIEVVAYAPALGDNQRLAGTDSAGNQIRRQHDLRRTYGRQSRHLQGDRAVGKGVEIVARKSKRRAVGQSPAKHRTAWQVEGPRVSHGIEPLYTRAVQAKLAPDDVYRTARKGVEVVADRSAGKVHRAAIKSEEEIGNRTTEDVHRAARVGLKQAAGRTAEDIHLDVDAAARWAPRIEGWPDCASVAQIQLRVGADGTGC